MQLLLMFVSSRLKRPEHDILLLHRKSVLKTLGQEAIQEAKTPLVSEGQNEETSARPSK